MVPAHDTVLYVQDSGAGKSLLFVHGICGDANMWNKVVERLAAEFRCIAYDRRGHTRSPRGRVGHSSIATHATDLADLIVALDLAPVLVVASDHGSDIVLELARQHPDMVRAAVLCGPPPRSIISAAAARYWKAVESAVAAVPASRASVDALFEAFDGSCWSRMPAHRREAARSNHRTLHMELTSASPFLSEVDLRRLTMPFAVVTGGKSAVEIGQIGAEIAASMAEAVFLAVPGAGSLAYLDQPDAFGAQVRSFAQRASAIRAASP